MTTASPPSAPRLDAWTLTTKLTATVVLLCVFCVAATSVVVGLQASSRAQAAAHAQADKAAGLAAARVGG